jgi:ribonucleoside-diphosphate reductase alpha chain
LDEKFKVALKKEIDRQGAELGVNYNKKTIIPDLDLDMTQIMYNAVESMRNTTLLAIAPTTSSSSILGQVSPGIEPFSSNYFKAGLAKGNFMRTNKHLKKLLQEKDKDNEDVWRSIMLAHGSVQHLDFLNQEEKDIFKTFEEISPLSVIQQSADRQKFICQGQSLNLMIPNSVEIKQINAWMIEAWKLGIKGLYYQRGTSVAKDKVLKMLECNHCEA